MIIINELNLNDERYIKVVSQIKAIRNANNINAEDLAKWAECSRSTLSEIENATSGCSLDLFIRIVKELGYEIKIVPKNR